MLTIYHGSNKIIKEPDYDINNNNNDFGQGFYTSINSELAKEWAVKNGQNGFLNEYILDTNKLDILDLTNPSYNILNWVACILKFRRIDITSRQTLLGIVYIINNYYIDINKYDLIFGYRCDDSHFKIVNDFLENKISFNKLSHFFMKDKDSKQLVLISKKAYSKLKFISYSIVKSKYYSSISINRDINIRLHYQELKNTPNNEDDIYLEDIMRRKDKNAY